MKTKQLKILILFFLFSFLFVSCHHYYLSVYDLQKALSKYNDSTKYYAKEIHGIRPIDIIGSATEGRKFHNGIPIIECKDENGVMRKYPVEASTKIRIAYKQGISANFIFYTMYMRADSVLFGRLSLNDNSYIRILPSDIVKIKILKR